ncbi:hypothetical protein G6F42_014401 [Rhizopus arrhizus]|nr:hypothetical protein G6F42_014401 [Rhizopus arrhizus]
MPHMMNNNDDIKKTSVASVAPCVNQSNPNDKLVQQLLKKLDEGSETILNLRSLLTLKTVELNELVHQLELIDQVLMNVENGTEQIEIVLKDVLVSKDQQDKLLNAEATLDSAIKSACSLYSIDLYSVNNKQSSPIKTASMLKKIDGILNELDIESTIDLSTLIKKKHSSASSMDKIKQLGSNIRKQVAIYQSYTRNAPLIIYGKEDIITILDREDHIIASRKTVHTTPNKQQQPTEKPARIHCSSTNTPKKRQSSSPSSSSPIKLRSKSTTNTTTTTATAKSTLQMISRPTLTFMAKFRKSRSELTSKQHLNIKNKQILSNKRRSLGSNSIKSTQTAVNHQPKTHWRSPGHCEIPNILGNAYLEPFTISDRQLKHVNQLNHHHQNQQPQQHESGPKRPPWVPAYNWTPSPLPPVIRTDETAFEKRLKKTLPKIHLVSMPKTSYLSCANGWIQCQWGCGASASQKFK